MKKEFEEQRVRIEDTQKERRMERQDKGYKVYKIQRERESMVLQEQKLQPLVCTSKKRRNTWSIS